MMARGLVPEWPADAAKLYDLFKSPKAAEHKYRRDGRVPAMFAATSYSKNGGTSAAGACMGSTSGRSVPPNAINIYSYSTLGDTSSVVCRFKPSGRGQRARRALIDPSKLQAEDARARIEAALGELAAFEVVEAGADV
jgi:hypothetical protein